MKTGEIEEILICVETNFEKLSFLVYTLSDLGEVTSKFLETIAVVMTFVFSIAYALFSEKSPDLLFGVVAAYIALVALMVTTAPTREQSLREVEFHHNIRRIVDSYSKKELFERHYPIIKILVMIKQKNPEINLLQLYKLNKDIFTAEALTSLLCGINLCSPVSPGYGASAHRSIKKDVENKWKRNWKEQSFCSDPNPPICAISAHFCFNTKHLYIHTRCSNIWDSY